MFEFDPFDPAYYQDPWPYYEVMRNEHPVYRRDIPNHRVWPHYWMLSRAADVDEALTKELLARGGCGDRLIS